MYPFQKDLLEKISSGGFKPGELSIMTAGRGVGKSMFTQQAIDRLMRDLNSNPITDLVLSEGTVYGARYYCIEPVGGNWPEMEEWCLDTYGSTQGSIWAENKAPQPSQRWYANNRKFWFRELKDRDWFILKWRS